MTSHNLRGFATSMTGKLMNSDDMMNELRDAHDRLYIGQRVRVDESAAAALARELEGNISLTSLQFLGGRAGFACPSRGATLTPLPSYISRFLSVFRSPSLSHKHTHTHTRHAHAHSHTKSSRT
mmetsp:Transcript_29666/g.64932  ORF Transcript_29666/g.64932 Transcript_29666/m.64932 type:complete len:124 (+) Transcript_29666:130-501(+)